MSSRWIKSGAILGFLAVAIGAFGHHALEKSITPQNLDIFEVGVRYQFYAVFAILLIAALFPNLDPKKGKLAANLQLYGAIIFSGSLYILAVTGQKWWGAITPIGGICFLAGYVVLYLATLPRPAATPPESAR